MNVTTDRLTAFLDRLRTLRQTQREFRHTQDSRLRNKLPAMELDLDNDVELLSAELRAAAINAEAEAAAEMPTTLHIFVSEALAKLEGGAA